MRVFTISGTDSRGNRKNKPNASSFKDTQVLNALHERCQFNPCVDKLESKD